MKDILLIIGIVMLCAYFILLITTFLMVKKSKNKRVEEVRDKLLKYVNLSMILTGILIVVIILRVVIFK